MKKFIGIFLILTMLFGLSSTVFAFNTDKVNVTLESFGNYLYKSVKEPSVSSIGGEWTVLGLVRSNVDIPDEYFENYYQAVEKYVKDSGGVLHNKKHTEYSRVILALTAIGKNPADVAGYNLLTPLADYEKTIWQGINGAIWALIALDSGNYDMPGNPDAKIKATREMYVNHILEKQTSDGGWALSGDTADADVTAMALCTLSKYQNNDKVRSATEKALDCLSRMQKENGGFSSYEEENCESSVQVLVALCELGISIDDARFVKNGQSVLDNLFLFWDKGKGFKHIHEGATNLMATEQCFYALVALKRASEGKNSLYDMSDVEKYSSSSDTAGLAEKNADVKKMSIINFGRTFDDISDHKYKTAIKALASRGIINGKTDERFEPDSTMTRAEFAAIIARGLGLPVKSSNIFKDVTTNDWFYNYVGTVYSYGIIKGISENEFNPKGTITREEAAVMVTRAAKLCGIDTEMDTNAVRDSLAQFFDYVKASYWSQNALAFCCSEKILDDSVMDIKPKEAITRAETASMLFNMLSLAKLL
ncbi:MAG: S-layer homology domain-containing protein [Clostridia bacterium]|nr:S-layer homology domain-containing protein [Clostridia bacterium]